MPIISSTSQNLDIELTSLEVRRESVNAGFQYNVSLGNSSIDTTNFNGTATLNNNITFNNELVYSLGAAVGPTRWNTSVGGLYSQFSPIEPGPLNNVYYTCEHLASGVYSAKYSIYQPGTYNRSVITITNISNVTMIVDGSLSYSIVKANGVADANGFSLLPGGWVTLMETSATQYTILCYYNMA